VNIFVNLRDFFSRSSYFINKKISFILINKKIKFIEYVKLQFDFKKQEKSNKK